MKLPRITMCGVRSKRAFSYRQIEFEGEANPRKGDLILGHARLLTPKRTYFPNGKIKSQTNYEKILRWYGQNEILAIGEDCMKVAATYVTKDIWLYEGCRAENWQDYRLVPIPLRFLAGSRKDASTNI